MCLPYLTNVPHVFERLKLLLVRIFPTAEKEN